MNDALKFNSPFTSQTVPSPEAIDDLSRYLILELQVILQMT